MIAITEDNLRSNVLRGENGGLSLRHTAVVRSLEMIGEVGSQESQPFKAQHTASVAREWRRENMHAIAFVQERKSRRVLVAAIRLAGE